jgi:hypothetical protein
MLVALPHHSGDPLGLEFIENGSYQLKHRVRFHAERAQ